MINTHAYDIRELFAQDIINAMSQASASGKTNLEISTLIRDAGDDVNVELLIKSLKEKGFKVEHREETQSVKGNHWWNKKIEQVVLVISIDWEHGIEGYMAPGSAIVVTEVDEIGNR